MVINLECQILHECDFRAAGKLSVNDIFYSLKSCIYSLMISFIHLFIWLFILNCQSTCLFFMFYSFYFISLEIVRSQKQ